MMNDGYQTSAVAKRLGVDSSTVRRWSRHFAAWLSVAAQVDTQEGRRYNDKDVAVLIRVKRLTSEGKTIQSIKEFMGPSQIVDAARSLASEATAPVERASDVTPAADDVPPPVSIELLCLLLEAWQQERERREMIEVELGDAERSRRTDIQLYGELYDEYVDLCRRTRWMPLVFWEAYTWFRRWLEG